MRQATQQQQPQLGFAFLDEAMPPDMAPHEVVAGFSSDLDAINYSLDKVIKHRGGLTQMQLADEMKITRAVMTKIKQGQASIPVGMFITWLEHTRSYALLQYYNFRTGLIVRSGDQEKDLQDFIAGILAENKRLKLSQKQNEVHRYKHTKAG